MLLVVSVLTALVVFAHHAQGSPDYKQSKCYCESPVDQASPARRNSLASKVSILSEDLNDSEFPLELAELGQPAR